jgi:putative ABC transport system permease protein
MTIVNLFRTALKGVFANKLRAFLTTLGIIIGVASVISMLALGNGARAAVESQFRFLGADEIQASEKMSFDNGQMTSLGKPLTFEDGLLMTDEVPLVSAVEMSVNTSVKVRHGRSTLDIGVQGTTADALTLMVSKSGLQPVGWPEGKPLDASAFIQSGRYFTREEVLQGEEVCVLGSQTAFDLFSGDDPVGETVTVNRRRCLVVGVLAELEPVKAENRYQSTPNQAFYMPISTVIRTFYTEEPSVYMTIRASDPGRVDETKQQIADYLRRRHEVELDAEGKYQDDFDLTTRKDILGAQQEAARTFSILLTAMAAVSLVVGGIGIMNVMLVSVTERTREIGVRLAVGARRRDIVRQFLIEAILISAGGGILGMVVGVLTIPLAASLNSGIALLAPESIPLSFSVALLTGLVFGLYPAYRAAQLDPIECLRSE